MSRLVFLTIWKSEDEGDTWSIVAPEDIPEWLKEEDIVNFLVTGNTAQAPGELTYYIGLKPGKSIGTHLQKTLLSEAVNDAKTNT